MFFMFLYFFFFNDTATTEIYTYLHTRSLHDALPISRPAGRRAQSAHPRRYRGRYWSAERPSPDHRRDPASAPLRRPSPAPSSARSEEHTSELQSLMRISYAVFCLKKKKHKNTYTKCTNPYPYT